MAERRIVAVGGGDVIAIWSRVLDLVRPSPRVLWVGTASAEDGDYALSVYDSLGDRANVRRVDFCPWPRRTFASSSSRRTWSSSAEATPPTCSRSGVSRDSTRFCARRGSRERC